MFNGIIFHTGQLNSIKKNKKRILIGIKTNFKLKKKILALQYAAMEYA